MAGQLVGGGIDMQRVYSFRLGFFGKSGASATVAQGGAGGARGHVTAGMTGGYACALGRCCDGVDGFVSMLA